MLKQTEAWCTETI